MKKIGFFLLILMLLQPVCYASAGDNYDNWHISSQHMKEFNLSEIGTRISQVMFYKQKSYFLNTVNFENNTSISSERLKELFLDKIGTRLTSDDISKMRKELTCFYKNNGYDSAIVNISHEKGQKGSLTFIIYEGPINKTMSDQKPQQ